MLSNVWWKLKTKVLLIFPCFYWDHDIRDHGLRKEIEILVALVHDVASTVLDKMFGTN